MHASLKRTISHYSFSIGILFFFIASIFLTLYYSTTSHTITSHAAGTTTFASPGDDLSTKVHALTPGDTLILHDGTYTGQFLIDSMHGTQISPITVQAEHDGKAIIDGGGNTSDQAVLEVKDSSYIVVKGFIVQNAGQEVVGVYDTSNHITIQRVTAHDAGPGNQHVFDIAYGPSYVLVEDCAGWGRGRYIFIAYHADHVTFRRTWAKWEKTDNFTPAPRSNYGAYGVTYVSFENVIGFNTIPIDATDDYYTGVWETSDGPTTNNISYYGSMFYNIWGQGIRVNDLQAFPNTVIKDSYFNVPLLPDKPSGYPNDRERGYGIDWVTSTTGIISNNVFINNKYAINQSDGIPTATNNIFMNNTQVIAGQVTDSYNDYWQNTGTNLASTDKQVDPGYDINTYGTGAYFFVPPNSPLKGAGENGGDMGAHIIYEYVDGLMTNTPLWPWPMEDRINAEKGVSVTWATNGGFWKTLNGVYGTTPSGAPTNITPSIPTSSTTAPSANNQHTIVQLNICPHGLGTCGDNVLAKSTGNTNPLHQTRLVTLTVLNATNQPVASFPISTTYNTGTGTFQGSAELTNVPAGQYLTSYHMDNFLSKLPASILVIDTPKTITLPTMLLTTGDINNDNKLDILDYNMLTSCFGKNQNSSTCLNKTQSDMNDDGVVDGTDYNLFLRELSVQTGN